MLSIRELFEGKHSDLITFVSNEYSVNRNSAVDILIHFMSKNQY